MNKTASSNTAADHVEQALCDTLAQEGAMLASARPVLKHLLSGNGHLLLNEQIVARVNAMLRDISRQLLFAQAEAADISDRDAFADERQAGLAVSLSSDADLLGHLHALAVEDSATTRIQQVNGNDPVLSPLLQELAGSEDEAVAGKSMSVVAAQARFVQQQTRMELPITELPGDQFHTILKIMREQAEGYKKPAKYAAKFLRASYDEGEARLGRIIQLLMCLGDDLGDALDLDRAGVAIFSTALALASGQERSRVIMAFNHGQSASFALCLRASGMAEEELYSHFLTVHPDAELPTGFPEIHAEKAIALLADSHAASAR